VVAVSADTGEDDPEVREEFDVKEGHHFDFFVIRDETKEVEEALMKQGFLQSRIRLERRIEGDQAYLTLRVRRGPRVEIRFDGATPPEVGPGTRAHEVAPRCLRQAAARRRRRSVARMADDRWLFAAEVEYKLTRDLG
jgi:hypothetical protein